MVKSRFFDGFAMATAGLGVLLFLVCVVAWGVTAAGAADIPPTSKMWQGAGSLLLTGLALRWWLGQGRKTGQENP